MTLGSVTMKEKLGKLDFIEMKNFSSKDIQKVLKIQIRK